ncbi:MAG: hypothetical protein II202_00005, partial [Bacteroidales bacterium]|nr:hypothetical protein [Bacteroidales bacterium]
MKENDMLEQMLSSVARLLVQREEALLERVAALEKKVEELEGRLEEARGTEVPDKVVAVVAVDEVAGEIQQVEAVDSEFEEDGSEMDAQVEDAADMDTRAEEVAEEESPTEPEMEIELEFFDDEEEEADVEVQEIEVEDAADEDVDDRDGFEAAAEDEEAGGYEEVECEEPDYAEEETVLVMDKARPDWYDWEVDIPGPYIEDIWDGIGLNDRLLFLKELFGGDEIDFSDALDALNEMTQL